MRNIFKKMLAGVTATALVASLLVGFEASKAEVKADDAATLTPWEFFQTGTTTDSWNAWELCAYSGVTFGNSGVAALTESDFPHGDIQTYATGTEVTAVASGVSNSFAATIKSNGWSGDYENYVNNPYALTAGMKGVKLAEGYNYTVSFKAKATSNKYATFGISDDNTNSYIFKTLALTTAEQTYTYDFKVDQGTNLVNVEYQFGAFVLPNGTEIRDQATNQLLAVVENSDPIVTTAESNWTGTVTISDVTFTKGEPIEGYETQPDKPSVNPTPETTTKPSTTQQPTTKAPVKKTKLKKVTKLKAVNKKKGTVKLTWKKVSKAKKYQIKVGKKTYTSKKPTKTIKKLKKGKKYTFKVRATATGYVSSAWVKKSIKIKK